MSLEHWREFYQAGLVCGRVLCSHLAPHPGIGRLSAGLDASLVRLEGGLEAFRAFVIGLRRAVTQFGVGSPDLDVEHCRMVSDPHDYADRPR